MISFDLRPCLLKSGEKFLKHLPWSELPRLFLQKNFFRNKKLGAHSNGSYISNQWSELDVFRWAISDHCTVCFIPILIYFITRYVLFESDQHLCNRDLINLNYLHSTQHWIGTDKHKCIIYQIHLFQSGEKCTLSWFTGTH